MRTYEKTTSINCNINDLFDFHLDVKNLKKITPKDTNVELLNKNFRPKEGEILSIKTKKNFISSTWQVKIQKLQRPNILVDLAIKSPFTFWEHSHIFVQKGNVCELKDVVRYKLPLGKFGDFFDFLIKKELKNMFEFRHKITKEILEKF